MILIPRGAGDSWLRHDLRTHMYALRDAGYMCSRCFALPEPIESVIVEVRRRGDHQVIGRANYCCHCYTNQAQAFDRDERVIIVYHGKEFFV